MVLQACTTGNPIRRARDQMREKRALRPQNEKRAPALHQDDSRRYTAHLCHRLWHSNSSIRISFVHDIHRHYFSRHTRSSTQPPPSAHYSYCNNVWGGEKSSFHVSVPRDGAKKLCPVWESGKWRCGKKRRTRAPPIRLSFGQRPFFFFHRFPAQTPLDAGDIHIHHSLLFLLFLRQTNPSYPFFCPKEPLFTRRKKTLPLSPSFPSFPVPPTGEKG